MQGKRIGVISSIANNPNNDLEINAKFAQAMADLQAGGIICSHTVILYLLLHVKEVNSAPVSYGEASSQTLCCLVLRVQHH